MKVLKAFLVAGLVAIIAGHALAVTSSQWQLKGQDFATGEMKNLSLSSKGQLRLEREFTKIETEDKGPLAIWSSAIDSKGTAYFGTGQGAAIYRLTPDNKLAKITLDEKFSTDVIVTKMLVDAKDNLYAAMMPSGRIIKITPEGVATEYATLPELYVWDMCFDANGDMYVATGPAGRLYKITDDGEKNAIVFDSEENHIFSLAFGDDGALYFGTSPGAILFKLTPEELAKEKPTPTVMYDFPATDIRAIYARQGEIYLAVNNAADKSAYEYSEEMLGSGESGAPSGPAAPGANGNTPAGIEYPVQGYEGGTVVKLDKNGDIQILLQSKNLVANIRGSANNIFIAAVGENRIYKYDFDRKELSFFTIKEPQALTFEVSNGDLAVVGTSGPGVVYRISDMVTKDGVYTSHVFDTSSLSDWGNIKCKASGKLSFQTRSGNTETPDNTWSGWSEEASDNIFLIKSPRGRFIQFRATWQEPQAVLEEVTIYYSAVNLRPAITAMMLGPGEGGGSMPSLPSNPPQQQAPAPEALGGGQPLQLTWQATDPNGDTLEFNLYYKESREKRWKLLTLHSPTREMTWVLQSALFPSGKYRLKLVASDKPGNPNGNALEAEVISDEFTIDNTAPQITNLNAATNKDQARNVTQTIIGGTVTEETTRVARIEYALDGAEWVYSLPKDGVFDNAAEEINIVLENLEPGEHTIVVRASDENGNMSTSHLVFEAPQP